MEAEASLRSAFSDISIELFEGNSRYLDGLLQDGKIELYVGIDVPNSLNQHRTILASEKLRCCFSEKMIRTFYTDTYKSDEELHA